MVNTITPPSLFHRGVICFMLVLFVTTAADAVNKETQFVPDEAYDFLFDEGLTIIRGNIIGKVIMGNSGYIAQPRIRSTSRPRRVEYTTFSFDGYWERRPWELKSPAGRYWDKRHKQDKARDLISGRWFFKVRWTTRTKWDVRHDLLTIVEFQEVMPDVYFIKHGASHERHDFRMKMRFPDHEHKTRAYIYGDFGIYNKMKR